MRSEKDGVSPMTKGPQLQTSAIIYKEQTAQLRKAAFLGETTANYMVPLLKPYWCSVLSPELPCQLGGRYLSQVLHC